jgi:hypothetical protein
MQSNVTPIERAFDLARSGTCRTVADIKDRLKLEGYRVEQVTGPELHKQLRTLMSQNQTQVVARPTSSQ